MTCQNICLIKPFFQGQEETCIEYMTVLLPQLSYNLVRNEAYINQEVYMHICLFLNDCLLNTHSVRGAVWGTRTPAVDMVTTLKKTTSYWCTTKLQSKNNVKEIDGCWDCGSQSAWWERLMRWQQSRALHVMRQQAPVTSAGKSTAEEQQCGPLRQI